MNDLYWLITLGNLSEFCCVIASLSGSAMLIALIFAYVSKFHEVNDDDRQFTKIWKNVRNLTFVVFMITFLPAMFIPSKNELYVIYGVGNTIDYIKNNPTAKQLPDKVIKACDIYMDNIIKDKQKDTTNINGK